MAAVNLFDYLEGIPQASYKNVPFLFMSGTVIGGRKDIAHLYPNSNRQSIEDLGKKQRGYKIRGIISGDDYEIKRDNLLRALETKGSGNLMHPFYGTVKNIKCRTFSLTETFTKFGEAIFDIIFDVDTDNATPKEAKVSEGEVSFLNNEYRKALGDNFSKKLKVSQELINSFESATNKVNSSIDTIKESTKFMSDITDVANSASSQISFLSNNVASLLNSPSEMFESFDGIFQTLGASTQSVEKAIDGFESMFGFGDDDYSFKTSSFGSSGSGENGFPSWIEIDNVATKEAKQNDKLINSLINSLALSWIYVFAASLKFITEDEVIIIQSKLDDQYKSIVEIPTAEVHSNETPFKDTPSTTANEFSLQNKSGLDSNSLDALSDLRIAANKFLDEVKKDAARTIQIETETTPMRELLYRYYGDSSNFADVNRINKLPDVSFINGTVEAISDIN